MFRINMVDEIPTTYAKIASYLSKVHVSGSLSHSGFLHQSTKPLPKLVLKTQMPPPQNNQAKDTYPLLCVTMPSLSLSFKYSY